MESYNYPENMNENMNENEEPIYYLNDDHLNVEPYYRKIVKIINQGNINPNGNYFHTPNGIKVGLKIHQQRMLEEMIKKEKMNCRSSSGINMCVLSDKVGAGKSITILSLICQNKSINLENISKSQNRFDIQPPRHYFYGLNLREATIINTNLIIVPHNIYSQWCEYIENFTDLTYYSISNSNDIKKMEVNKLGEYDIVLVKSTKYTEFIKIVYEKEPLQISYEDFSSELFNDDSSMVNNNLKHKLYSAWNSFNSHTFGKDFTTNLKNLKQKLNDINFETVEQELEVVGDYLVSEIKKIKGPIFQRVIIDEVNSIRIPNFQEVYGIFNWFITSSVNELLYPSGEKRWKTNKWEVISRGISGYGFIKNIFNENSRKILGKFVQRNFLKNNDNFVEESFNLPEPIVNKLECYTPNELKILQKSGLTDIINALNAGDNNTALKLVGCDITSEENIVDKVLKKFLKELQEKNENVIKKTNQLVEIEDNIENSLLLTKEEVDNLKSKKYSTKKSIENLKEQINNLEVKIESIKERIVDSKDKDCSICMDKVNIPVLTPCCKNVFCLECLTLSLDFNKKTCPLCRNNLEISNVTYISENENILQDDKKESDLPTKLERFLTLIKEKPEGKFLLFSEFDATFMQVVNQMEKEGIVYSNICGSTGQIKNIINNYDKGKIKVLMLNAKHYGSGLNLQMTTDIIIYHKMTPDLEKQVIGRGQRLGRKEALNIHHLCYQNEL